MYLLPPYSKGGPRGVKCYFEHEDNPEVIFPPYIKLKDFHATYFILPALNPLILREGHVIIFELPCYICNILWNLFILLALNMPHPSIISTRKTPVTRRFSATRPRAL